MKIYVAALFSSRPYMELVCDKLKSLGHKVTARWAYGGEEGLSRTEIALLDLEDIEAADTVVSFTLPHGTVFSGGGRHVEFGYGLAKGKRMVLIGERECVFHHHPSVYQFDTLNSWLKHQEDKEAELKRRRRAFLEH